jgi:hypothetical protein
VSASITAEAIDRLRSSNNGGPPTDAGQDIVDPIREALAALNAVRYGRVGEIDVQVLDQTLENGRRALHRLRMARLWPARAAAALSKSATLFGVGAWRS